MSQAPKQKRRCVECGAEWPWLPEFERCAACGGPCAIMRADEDDPQMDFEAARKRAKYAKFERYINEETDEERERRRGASDVFTQIIGGAGFQDWERESIRKTETEIDQADQEKAS